MDVHEKAELIKIMAKGPVIQQLLDEFYTPKIAQEIADDPRNWSRHEWDMIGAFINLDKCGYKIVRKEKKGKKNETVSSL